MYKNHTLACILSVHHDDIQGMARREVAAAPLKHLEEAVGICKAERRCPLHMGIQYEHKAGEVYTHHCDYIDAVKSIDPSLFTGLGDEESCGDILQEASRTAFCAVARTVLANRIRVTRFGANIGGGRR